MKRKHYTSIREVKAAKRRREELKNDIMAALLWNVIVMGLIVLWFIG